MRTGDFSVELVPASPDHPLRETDSGHVLARPGTVYSVRLRNHGPLRCVADVKIDGNRVTERGLVIDAYAATTLERPVTAGENGRFTVFAEGDERVFGEDGGRDNAELGSIEVSFRRELPREGRHDSLSLEPPAFPRPIVSPGPSAPGGPHAPGEPRIPTPPGRPMAPPEWTPPGIISASAPRYIAPDVTVHRLSEDPRRPPIPTEFIERAAGTGLTGSSTQEFVPIAIGPLEHEATVICLRIVIGSDEAINAPRPLAAPALEPARPPARP